MIGAPARVIGVAEVAMSLRKVRDAFDARACLADAAASGSPRAVWARSHGVDPRSLNAWRVNLARGRRSVAPLRLVELVPTDDDRPSFVVRVGVFTVEVDAGFEPSSLRRLLEVVASC